MNKDWKATTGMIVKILVILALPLLLFRYVESQPIVKVADEPKQETKSVAIVNEDNGLTLNDNVLKLGSEIPLLLKEQKDYSWTVVDRSTAEKGLSSKKYDAVIYIPSNFSLDVMTFKENRPTKATVRYVIQPNLDAKNRQRVHKEMAVAKNKINEEMSKMYWDYVAQEIDHIRDNFDKIVEKEVDFQNAMYSFYSPSSKTLAEEIKRQKKQLENILNQTDTVHSVSADSVDRAAESEKEVKQFADALDAYQQLQLKQKQLWGEFQLGNRKSIDEGIAAYNKALQDAVQSIDEQIQSYDSLAYKQDENAKEIKDNLEFIAFELQNGRDAVFAKDDPKNRTVLEGQLFQMNKTLLASYNNSLLEGSFSKLANASGAIKNNSGKEDPPEIEIPEVDEPGDGEEIGLDELQANAQALRNAVNQVKASASTTEAPVAEKPATDKEDAAEGKAEGSQDAKGESNADAAVGHTKGWKQVESSLNGLDNTISKLQSKAGKQRTGDWEKYASDMNKAYRELQTTANEVSDIIADNILNAQAQIEQNIPEYNKYDQLGDITKRLEGVFLTESQLENQDTALLLAYSQALSTFTMILDKSSKEFEENLVHLLNGKEMKKVKGDILSADEEYTKQMGNMFDKLLGKKTDGTKENVEGSVGKVEEVEKTFDELVTETNDFLKTYETQINEQFNQILAGLAAMETTTGEVTNQLQTANFDSFDWEEAPDATVMNGQMVFHMQKGALTNLQRLSQMVGSLEKSQKNITSETGELQQKIHSVQSRSDELNNKWSKNVLSTKQVKKDVYDVLGNTIIDGQKNPFVYNYLANPVNVEGKTSTKVATEKVEPVPPVILLMIILISGLLIGFITNYYAKLGYLLQGGLFLLLNIAVGLIISIYSLQLYDLQDAQTIRWMILTILLLMACSNIVRGGLFVHTFVGWLASIAMIVFFVTPLIDIAVPEFGFTNPVADVYMGIQYGLTVPYTVTIVVLAIIVVIISGLIYGGQYLASTQKVDENEEKAS